MRPPGAGFPRLLHPVLVGIPVLIFLSAGSIATEPPTAPSSSSSTLSTQTSAQSSSSSTSSTQASTASDTLIIGATGDIMLGSWLIEVLNEQGADYPYGEVLPVLQSADLLVGNLESPFLGDTTGVVRAEKTYTFSVPPGIVETLTAGGFDLVGLANNHILDFGPAGLFETWSVLDSAGIAHTGTGRTKGEAHRHTTIERQGRRVAFLAYSHTFPEEFWATADRPGTAHASDEGLAREVGRAGEDADLVVVLFHWGGELLEEPREYQKILARIAIDNGADLVIGHHPHILQPLEWYHGRLIAYSLGNFVFGSFTPTAKGAVLLVRFVDRGPVSADLYPIDVNNLRREFRPGLLGPSRWSILESSVLAALVDSAAAGHPGVRIEEDGFLRLLPP
ncbi:CapA family protein [Gemmatimonadota bacterium]